MSALLYNRGKLRPSRIAHSQMFSPDEVREMERKSVEKVQVEVTDVKTSLARQSKLLSGVEEQALRMRHGASVDKHAPLARAAGGNAELEDELLLIEMQLLRTRMQREKTQGLPQAPVRAEAAVHSPTKSKIVRALRRKH